MIKKYYFYIFLFLLAAGFCLPFFHAHLASLKSGLANVSGVFAKVFEEKISPDDLLAKYKKGSVKILIVPGHDNDSPGVVYNGLRETDANKELAYTLLDYLRQDGKFRLFVIRERDGNYAVWFSKYLDENLPAVGIFRDYLRSVFSFFQKKGEVKKEVKVYHNPAADNVSLNLYAINKWANDNNVDIVLHIHFNDYPTRKSGQPGQYSGFAIYVPEKQLPNHRVSLALAEAIKSRLEKYFPVSNFPGERGGIVEDQQLIAIGSNASRKGASLLFEAGYIYEPQFMHPEARAIIFKSLAEQIYSGLESYFGQ